MKTTINQKVKVLFLVGVMALISVPTLAQATQITHPERECCVDEEVTLSCDTEGDSYLWSNGATTRSIKVKPDKEEVKKYSCQVFKSEVLQANNLMKNGSFEMWPAIGFTSEYTVINDRNPKNIYAEGSEYAGKSGILVISNDANYTWKDYMKVTAQEGSWFALIDADANATEKIAWKASTSENPNLKIKKGITYHFSYWACNIDNPDSVKIFNNFAILKFAIQYTENGVTKTENLGTLLTLSGDNNWHQNTVNWKSPVDCDDISIIIKNLNTNEEYLGNDFGLDNIIFQPTDGEQNYLSAEELFTVKAKSCSAPEVVDTVKHDFTVCQGDELILTPTNIGSYLWNDGTTNQTYVANTDAVGTSTYVCTITTTSADEVDYLVTPTAGGFEFPPSSPIRTEVNGKGQTINYEYLNFQSNPSDIPQGSTTTAQNANNVKPSYFSNLAPHSGNWMLVCDGSSSSNAQVWSARNLKLEKDTTYEFSCWLANIDMEYTKHGASSLPRLQFFIENSDGKQPLGEVFTASATPGKWEQHKATYRTTKAYDWCHIFVVNSTTYFEGNDFALDDIVFSIAKTKITKEVFNVTVEDCTPPLPPSCYDDMVYVKWDDVLFCDNGQDLYVGYQWYCDSVALQGETKQYLHFQTTNGVATQASSFYVCATTIDGDVHCSCDKAYSATPRSADQYGNNQPAATIEFYDNLLIISQMGDFFSEACIYSVHGSMLKTYPLKNGEIIIKLELAKGVYIVNLRGEKDKIYSAKIVVK